MYPKLRALLALSAVIALPMSVAACGSDDSDDSSTESGVVGVPEEFQPVTAAPDDAQEGGSLTMLNAGDVDYMDPGAAYYQTTYTVTQATQRALLAWDPDDVEKATPDLADGEAEISDDGLTITFKLKEGVEFAPPVSREVTSADVKYAIERTVLPGVLNGYVANYASDIVGFEEAAKEAEDNPTGGAPDMAGITTPDDYTLQIELNEPEVATATTVASMLSLPISAPVPEEFAEKHDAKNPTTYGQYVIATGPYMIENDPETGELTGYTPGKEIHLVRNPNWDPDTDWRPAYLDEITIQEGFTDTASASRKILEGDSQMSGDFPPPKEVLKEAAEGAAPEQLQLPPLAGFRHIALNTQEPPFDDENIRKAVVANSDREALRNTRGGPLVGQVATHYISPGFPGFEEGGGLEGPDLDFIKSPTGDPDLAAEYMKEAGFESGKCEGDICEITMVGDNIPPGKDTAEVFKGQLEDLGFKVNFQPVDHSIMYTRFCSVPEQSPQVCPNVGWLPDFRDPQPMLDVPFYGPFIDPENNSNWPQLDDPEVNAAIEEARTVNGEQERADAWGEVDRLVSSKAPAVPWIWENFPLIQSEDVAGVVNLNNASWDLSFTSLKGE
jgi:peptide/nickel transport system substrate-binding protein